MRDTVSISWSLSRRQAERRRHLAADRRLAGAHQTDKHDRAPAEPRRSRYGGLGSLVCIGVIILVGAVTT
jgi:hypothetical protein